IHSTFNGQTPGENVIVGPLGNSTAPFCWSGDGKIDRIQCGGTTIAGSIDYFNIHQRQVSAIGPQAARPHMLGQPDGSGLARGFSLRVADFQTARVVAHRADSARLPCDVLESVKEPTSLLAEPQRRAVDQQLYFFGTRNYVDVLLCSGRVVPMTYDMNPWPFDINPTIPHNLMREVSILWQAHRVDFATPAIIFGAATVSI